jgi:hypothetical protein
MSAKMDEFDLIVIVSKLMLAKLLIVSVRHDGGIPS